MANARKERLKSEMKRLSSRHQPMRSQPLTAREIEQQLNAALASLEAAIRGLPYPSIAKVINQLELIIQKMKREKGLPLERTPEPGR
jgi:hypothetical protein